MLLRLRYLGENMIGFTFYADLLGMSGYYRLSPKVAYRKLNKFYNTTFSSFRDYCQANPNIHIEMFSDSLLIWGNDAEQVLNKVHDLYLALTEKSLLLRGAIVKGTLMIDPRLTLDNFQKFLPENDMLPRAVGLENTQKGARLLIENTLVEELLSNHLDWMTNEGYLNNIEPIISVNSILRRISPTPDNQSYELLYFWGSSNNFSPGYYDQKIKELKEVSAYLKDSIAVHYEETIALLNRSKLRHQMTEERLNAH
jgi:hypothetical protein